MTNSVIDLLDGCWRDGRAEADHHEAEHDDRELHDMTVGFHHLRRRDALEAVGEDEVAGIAEGAAAHEHANERDADEVFALLACRLRATLE